MKPATQRFTYLPRIAFVAPGIVPGLLASTAIGQAGTDDKEITPVMEKPENSIWNQQYLLGDWGGERTKLEQEGVKFDFNEIGDFNIYGIVEKTVYHPESLHFTIGNTYE